MATFKTKLFIVLTCLFLFVQNGQGQWLSGYTHRKKITIQETQNSGNTALNNFSILINNTSNNLKLVGNRGEITNTNEWDIRFSESNGLTTLNSASIFPLLAARNFNHIVKNIIFQYLITNQPLRNKN